MFNSEKKKEMTISVKLHNGFKQNCIPGFCRLGTKALNYHDETHHVGIKRRLRAMENAGQLVFTKLKQYVIPPKNSLITGKVTGHRDGFGFFVPDVAIGEKRGKDFYISSHEMQRVFHGDIVSAILVDRTDRKGRQEIKIIEVTFCKSFNALSYLRT